MRPQIGTSLSCITSDTAWQPSRCCDGTARATMFEQRLPVLSTFLGHGSIASTYWYLSSHPELMVQAMQRLEQRWEKLP
jgi:hypothetical protein